MQRPVLFPTVGVAFWITLLALLSSFAVVGIVAGLSGGGSVQLAEALGLVVGFGGVGTLAARQVPPPQAERLGLRGMRLRFFLPLLLLIPVALLASEVDNLVKAVLSQAQGSEIAEISEKLKSAAVLEMVGAAIVAIGIQPVVSEWFYRGVVQQGLVAQLGVGRGIVITALLYALALSQGVVGTSFVLWLAATLSEFVNGIAYGLTRHYSGSLLAPILLHVALNASASLALGCATRVPIPGFNTAGVHTPIQFLIPAAASVAFGIALMVRFGGRPGPTLHHEPSAGKGESAPPR
ncbi:MAG TPA: CPBP family intramembrane glutamic endopeptidase [Myxococcota bacterium]|nr:CPBP family intramembrane glutamic endopeptidase [Myxococcota bacterium]